MTTTRRTFLRGCCVGIAAMSGARIRNVAFAAPGADTGTLVVVFLRGGMDGLNFLPPIDGPNRGHYQDFRPTIALPLTGDGAALPLTAEFGLHSRAIRLHELYQAGKVALIQGAGMPDSSRSHFDAMNYMEFGTPGRKIATTGWITRHLRSSTGASATALSSLSMGSLPATSLAGNYETVVMTGPNSFNLDVGPYQWRDAVRIALRTLHEAGASEVHEAGTQALNSIDLIERNVDGDYTPSNGAIYPQNGFGDQLETIAQMIRLNIGLSVATIDLGGWDTHENQGGDGTGGYFGDRIGTLCDGITALYQDLNDSVANNPASRLTVVVMSEFGRRVRENGDRGTDHGTGNAMIVLGGKVNGGRLYGSFPGLNPDQLFDGADLAPLIDYRTILSEILIRQFRNANLGTVFPGYKNHAPLGILQGSDLPPNYNAIRI